ncbi:MAG TPA: PTS sugar transporter subunit IIA [Candidatus Polarisedimenticolia bacterium]|nr:PTS sugar transporter subunit IIA [Candidatus Polarisedimenticolia bacterium]
MLLTDLLRDDLIFLDLHPGDMEECLETMAVLMRERGAIGDKVDTVTRLMERERTMSTGMGGGVAVPHAKSPLVKRMTVAMGQVPDGVDFKAIDGKPVHIVFLLLGPPDSTREHVDLLARIAYLVKSPGVIEALRGAASPAQVMTAIRGAAAR